MSTPLFDAVWANDVAEVRRLVRSGSEIDERIEDLTPLYAAVDNCSLECLDFHVSFVFMKTSLSLTYFLGIGVLNDSRKLNFLWTPRSAIPPSFDLINYQILHNIKISSSAITDVV